MNPIDTRLYFGARGYDPKDCCALTQALMFYGDSLRENRCFVAVRPSLRFLRPDETSKDVTNILPGSECLFEYEQLVRLEARLSARERRDLIVFPSVPKQPSTTAGVVVSRRKGSPMKGCYLADWYVVEKKGEPLRWNGYTFAERVAYAMHMTEEVFVSIKAMFDPSLGFEWLTKNGFSSSEESILVQVAISQARYTHFRESLTAIRADLSNEAKGVLDLITGNYKANTDRFLALKGSSAQKFSAIQYIADELRESIEDIVG